MTLLQAGCLPLNSTLLIQRFIQESNSLTTFETQGRTFLAMRLCAVGVFRNPVTSCGHSLDYCSLLVQWRRRQVENLELDRRHGWAEIASPRKEVLHATPNATYRMIYENTQTTKTIKRKSKS